MKSWGEKNGIEFFTMPVERAEEALDVLRNGFFEDELFCNVVGINKDKPGQRDLELLALDCARDNISIMAVDKLTGKIVGVAFNKHQVPFGASEKGYFENFRDAKCKAQTAKDLITLMIDVDAMVDLYGMYKADCSGEIMFLATHKNFRRRGIGVGCVSASLDTFRSLPSTECPKKVLIATSIFTSPWSIRVGQILGFDEVVHIPINEIKNNGNSKIDKEHTSSIVMAKQI